MLTRPLRALWAARQLVSWHSGRAICCRESFALWVERCCAVEDLRQLAHDAGGARSQPRTAGVGKLARWEMNERLGQVSRRRPDSLMWRGGGT